MSTPTDALNVAGPVERHRNVKFNLYEEKLPQATEYDSGYGGQWSSEWCVVIDGKGRSSNQRFTVSGFYKEALDRGERVYSNWESPGWTATCVAWAYCKEVGAALASSPTAGTPEMVQNQPALRTRKHSGEVYGQAIPPAGTPVVANPTILPGRTA